MSAGGRRRRNPRPGVWGAFGEKEACMVGVSSLGNDRLASNVAMTRTSKIGSEAVRLNTPPPPYPTAPPKRFVWRVNGRSAVCASASPKKNFVLSEGEKKCVSSVYRNTLED